MKQSELEKDIQFVKGVGEKRAALFHKLGIFNVGDLLQYYPRAYLDKSDLKTAAQAEDGEKCALRCTMISAVTEHRIRRGLTLYKCSFSDGETVIRVTIFNNVYLAKALRIYEEYLLYGKIEKNLTWAAMSSPMIEPFAAADAITPVYAATERLSSKTIERIVKTALKEVQFTETLSEQLLVRFALAGKNFAMHEIHFPAGRKNLEEARRRLIFEELLVLNLGVPPTSFDYVRKDAQGKRVEVEHHTPQTFLEKYGDTQLLTNYVMVMNDPTREYYKCYEIAYDRHRYDGKNWRYVNLPVEDIKQMAIASLKDHTRMYFSSDVTQLDAQRGLLDVDIYDYGSLLGTTFGMDKKQRIQTFSSLSAHAMTLMAVDLDENGKPVKWMVENSWGPSYGYKGHLIMTDRWFDEYMFRLVLETKYVPAKVLKIFEQDPVLLPAWDPMFAEER